MSNQAKSLWPEKFDTFGEIPPVAILREQADLLGASTQNIVEGMVVSTAHKNRIIHSLVLRAPVLGTRTEIFQIQHELSTLYPCSCYSLYDGYVRAFLMSRGDLNQHDLTLFQETNPVPDTDGFIRLATTRTHETLEVFLREFFQSDSMKKTIGALISQSLSPAA